MVNEFFTPMQQLLMSGKQLLCSDYLNSPGALQETSLPAREKFFNSLQQEHVSERDYEHALSIFRLGKFRNLGEYIEAYLRVDVGLLANVFCNWHNILHKLYELDCSFYWSLSSFSFDCFLKSNKTELEALHDRFLYRVM